MIIAKLQTSSSTEGGKSSLFQLNQHLHATVIKSGSGNKQNFQIDGKTYNFQASTLLTPGKLLSLKVVSLTPLQFELTEPLQSNSKTRPDSTTTLSSQVLQLCQHQQRKNIASLLQGLKAFSFVKLQALPAEALALLNTLKQKIIKAEDLSNARKLKPALLQSGLLLESKLADQGSSVKSGSLSLDSDLKAILLKLFHSLGKNTGSFPSQSAALGTRKPDDLSLYQLNTSAHFNRKLCMPV